jgi:hypothetical protein
MTIDLNSASLALFGGVLIGVSASLLLAFTGRIAGISGILYRSFTSREDSYWRFAFLAGLVLGGVFLYWQAAELVTIDEPIHMSRVIAAGLLVGFGSVLGNGCTSGHGVCGISRFSPRSIAATLTFMACGAVVVFVIRRFFEM